MACWVSMLKVQNNLVFQTVIAEGGLLTSSAFSRIPGRVRPGSSPQKSWRHGLRKAITEELIAGPCKCIKKWRIWRINGLKVDCCLQNSNRTQAKCFLRNHNLTWSPNEIHWNVKLCWRQDVGAIDCGVDDQHRYVESHSLGMEVLHGDD
jgi:hypothetical protein